MNNRYLAWTLLITAGALQAYLAIVGSRDLIDFETVILPSLLFRLSQSLSEQYLRMPFFVTLTVFTFFAPILLTIFSWVFIARGKKLGWNLALLIDLFFALPSLALLGTNFLWDLKHHHLRIEPNPEVLLLVLAVLHMLILCSPPIRALILPPNRMALVGA